MASEQRERLLIELERIQRQISEGGEEAAQSLARIARELSPSGDAGSPPQQEDGAAEPSPASGVEEEGQE